MFKFLIKVAKIILKLVIALLAAGLVLVVVFGKSSDATVDKAPAKVEQQYTEAELTRVRGICKPAFDAEWQTINRMMGMKTQLTDSIAQQYMTGNTSRIEAYKAARANPSVEQYARDIKTMQHNAKVDFDACFVANGIK